jgi:hypothetical protein
MTPDLRRGLAHAARGFDRERPRIVRNTHKLRLARHRDAIEHDPARAGVNGRVGRRGKVSLEVLS